MNRIEQLCLGATGAFVLAAAVRWYAWAPGSVAAPVSGGLSTTPYRVLPDSALEAAEDLVVSNDPFRLSNSPPDVLYDPVGDAVPPGSRATAPVAVRPIFALKAIVGGPPWQAVIDGIPGEPAGTVTRTGATYDKLLVRSVTRDSVIIQGPDTSWVLSFARRP